MQYTGIDNISIDTFTPYKMINDGRKTFTVIVLYMGKVNRKSFPTCLEIVFSNEGFDVFGEERFPTEVSIDIPGPHYRIIIIS